MDFAPSKPQMAHYSVGFIYLLSYMGIKEVIMEAWCSELGLH